MTIVINTPNSHIGRRVTERLLDSEMPVSIITRNPDKVRDLAVQGASLLVGSCDDEELLSRAFEGAEAVFWLTPPNYRPDYQSWVRDTASKAATALHDARVEHIVNVSSIGAHAGPKTGPIAFLGEVESILSEAAPNVVHLRPGSFMENHLADVPTIASAGAIYSPLPRNAPMATIASDILSRRPICSALIGRARKSPRAERPRRSQSDRKAASPVRAYIEVSIEQSREARATSRPS